MDDLDGKEVCLKQGSHVSKNKDSAIREDIDEAIRTLQWRLDRARIITKYIVEAPYPNEIYSLFQRKEIQARLTSYYDDISVVMISMGIPQPHPQYLFSEKERDRLWHPADRSGVLAASIKSAQKAAQTLINTLANPTRGTRKDLVDLCYRQGLLSVRQTAHHVMEDVTIEEFLQAVF